MKMFDVNKYIGTPYVDHGRSKEGCDCWGLVRLVYKQEYGITLPSYTEEYSSSEEAIEVSALVNNAKLSWQPVELGQEEIGDVVVLRLLGHPMHVGLVIGWPYMLHVMRGINAVVEDYTSSQWKRRVVGIYRYERAK